MTNSESMGQKFLKKYFGPNAYIKKIPDFKQTGSLSGGMPDYMVISNGMTLWYEIKSLSISKKSFAIKEFTDQQLCEFPKIIKAGGKIVILLYHGKDMYIIPWISIYNYFRDDNIKSIKIKEFERWCYNGKRKV